MNLEKRLNDEILKNQQLQSKIQSLSNNNNQYQNEITSLKNQIQQLKKENDNLRKSSNQNDIINKLKLEIENLKDKLNQKENENNNLKSKLSKFEKPKYYYDEIMVVNFISSDHSIQCGIKCFANETFAEVEEKLYQKFDDFRNFNNMFLFQGNQILRFKKISENNIKDGDLITLVKNSNED